MLISQNIKQKIDAIRGDFPTEQALLLPLLHEIQAEQGWISPEAIREAANFLHLAPARVEEVVSFYTMFNREPVGKHHVQLCTNIACYLRGANHLMQCLEKRLGIREGETRSDGKFTLSAVECLAACGTAPAMQVNEQYHENLSESSLLKIIDELERGA